MSVTEAAPAPRAAPGEEPSAPSVLVRIALLALGIRVALQVVGMIAVAASGQDPWSRAISMWNRWDAPHYLRIAEVGYRSGSPPPDDPLFIVFFPFFPLAVRIASFVFRDLVLSGLIVSCVAAVSAAWMLYRLARLEAGHQDAWRSVVLLFAFPTAYFLAAPYTESLFLVAVVGSVYAARTARWPRAAIAGALATGTRVAGVALAPALVAEAVGGHAPLATKGRRLVWAALAGTGLLTYLAINQVVHGDPLWFLEVQHAHWSQRAVAPWTPVVAAVRGLIDGVSSDHTFIFRARLAAYAAVLPLLVLAIRRLPISDWLYGWAAILIVGSTSWLISLPRYLLGIYPLFLVGAQLVRSRRVLWPVVAAGAVLQIWFFSRYAVGRWTF